MNAKTYLSQIAVLDRRIESKIAILTDLRAMAEKANCVMSDVVVSHSRNNHAMEDVIIKIADMKEQIARDFNRLLDLKKKKRVVVKIGTSTLTHHKTGRLNIRRVEKLVKILADLQNEGKEIILVSSGAVGLGAGKLGLAEKPKDTPTKQACAAVGQCELMYMYDKLFGEYGLTVAQLLLTKFVLLEERKVNVQKK